MTDLKRYIIEDLIKRKNFLLDMIRYEPFLAYGFMIRRTSIRDVIRGEYQNE